MCKSKTYKQTDKQSILYRSRNLRDLFYNKIGLSSSFNAKIPIEYDFF